MDNCEKRNFESDMNRLRDIVRLLEEGNLTLEDSLKYFEEGIKLYRSCTQILNNAEQKISILLFDEDGAMKMESFEDYEEE